MEVDVVNEKHLRRVRGAKETGDLFGQGGEVVGCRAFGGETCGRNFENATRLVELITADAVEGGQKAEGLTVETRRPLANVTARPVARANDAHGREGSQPGTDRGATDAQLLGKRALRRQAISGPECPTLN